MSSSPPQDSSGAGLPGFLRPAALGAALAGAVGVVVFMLMVGRHNQSWLLLGMFVGWVLAPFIAYALADRCCGLWPAPARMALHALALTVALGSLLIYGTMALGPPRPKPAAVFLLVPLGSGLLALVVVPVVVLVSRRRASRKS